MHNQSIVMKISNKRKVNDEQGHPVSGIQQQKSKKKRIIVSDSDDIGSADYSGIMESETLLMPNEKDFGSQQNRQMMWHDIDQNIQYVYLYRT